MSCMLDRDFIPMISVINDFKTKVAESESQKLIIRMESHYSEIFRKNK